MLLPLDTKKANARDGISARMSKSTARSIAYSVALLFNNSISTGKIPKAWKVSSVVPVPKGSDSTSVSNYRPISLLPVISKLLERHMHFLISCQIETLCPIAAHQWGFQSGKSAVSALIDVVHHWILALDQRKEMAAVSFISIKPLIQYLTSPCWTNLNLLA